MKIKYVVRQFDGKKIPIALNLGDEVWDHLDKLAEDIKQLPADERPVVVLRWAGTYYGLGHFNKQTSICYQIEEGRPRQTHEPVACSCMTHEYAPMGLIDKITAGSRVIIINPQGSGTYSLGLGTGIDDIIFSGAEVINVSAVEDDGETSGGD